MNNQMADQNSTRPEVQLSFLSLVLHSLLLDQQVVTCKSNQIKNSTTSLYYKQEIMMFCFSSTS